MTRLLRSSNFWLLNRALLVGHASNLQAFQCRRKRRERRRP